MIFLQTIGYTALFMTLAFFMWAFAANDAPGRPTLWNGSHADGSTVFGLMACGSISMFIGSTALVFLTESDTGGRYACAMGIIFGAVTGVIFGIRWRQER